MSNCDSDSDSDKIDALRVELHAYHEEIVGLMREHAYCQQHINSLSRVVYGNGDPGLKGNVHSLIESRNNTRKGLAVVWAALITLAAALVKSVWGN